MHTHTLETHEASVVYDVDGPLPTVDGRPLVFMVGQPMEATGFRALASQFADRTVVTYDPRGLGRSTCNDGRADNDPVVFPSHHGGFTEGDSPYARNAEEFASRLRDLLAAKPVAASNRGRK